MRTALFVQARLNSTRMPKKMFLPLHENNPIIYYSLQAVSETTKHDERILLIPYGETEYFIHVAKQFDFRIIEGPEQDLLGRFIVGLNALPNIDAVIRGCADKVIYDKFSQNIIIEEHKKHDCVMTHITEDPIRSVTSEIYKADSLYNVNDCHPWFENVWKYKREHIKPLFVDYPNFWKVQTVPAQNYLINKPINMSIDTEKDIKRMAFLFEDLYDGKPVDFFKALIWFNENEC